MFQFLNNIVHPNTDDKNQPQEKEIEKGKMVVWRDLINSWEKKRRKGKSYPSESRGSKNCKEK